jgi:hypothetical protein
VRLGAPLPSHLLFGPHGQEVESLLEQILTLTPAKVMAIPLPADLHPETGKDRDHLIIPGEQVPARHPSHESDATLIATAWLEAVGWASGDDAGGHYYSGCYFDYHLSESHWLNALGILRRAVWATVRGEDLPPEKRAAWLAEWVSLANGGGRRERA